MNKLIFTAPLMMALLVTSVLAMSLYIVNIHGTDGTLNYIGSDNSFNSSKLEYSSHFRLADTPKNGNQGQGGLNVIAVTSDDKRIVLNVRFDLKNIIVNTAERLYTDNTGKATYWKAGVGVKTLTFDTIRYDYNLVTKTLNIAGESTEGINFRVSNIQIK